MVPLCSLGGIIKRNLVMMENAFVPHHKPTHTHAPTDQRKGRRGGRELAFSKTNSKKISLRKDNWNFWLQLEINYNDLKCNYIDFGGLILPEIIKENF